MITKTTIECYKIRLDNGTYADITIDENGNAGRIQIASDYGDWQNYWGACSTPFKEFLAGLDIHYAASKFGASGWFDLYKTISNLKIRIKEYTTDEEEIAALENELHDLEDSTDKDEFVHKMWYSDKLLEMENSSPDLVMTNHPGFVNFWEKLWPIFIEQIKTEEQCAKNV